MAHTMKTLLRAAVVAAIALPLTTSAIAAADTADAAAEAAILAIWDQYETTRVAADYEGWLALWDEEGIKMSQGMPAIGYAMFDEKVAPKFQPGALG
jgi:hypothetical protein